MKEYVLSLKENKFYTIKLPESIFMTDPLIFDDIGV